MYKNLGTRCPGLGQISEVHLVKYSIKIGNWCKKKKKNVCNHGKQAGCNHGNGVPQLTLTASGLSQVQT